MKRLISFITVLFVLISGVCYGTEAQDDLTISMAGDMMFSGSVEKAVNQYGADGYFAEFTPIMRNSDLMIGNLETCLSDIGQPVADKQYTFRGSPQMARFLKMNNVTLVSIANNHSMDYGREAFLDMLDNLERNGIRYGGGGRNRKQAESLVLIEKKGMKIGFAAFSRVVPHVDWYAGDNTPGITGAYKVQEASVLKRISDYRKQCDILIVSVHWGKEGSNIPRKQEMELAHKLVDAGADVVMGHHPHVVQGIEMYKGSPIFYSLGNFAFTSSKSQIANKTMLVTLKFNRYKKLASINIKPGLIKYSRPVAMDSNQEKEFIEYLNRLNINFKL